MPRSTPRVRESYFYLREDEEPLLRVRAAGTYALALLAAPILFLTILLVVALVARAFLPAFAEIAPPWAPFAGWLAFALVAVIAAWRRAATTEYAITDERIYARHGRFITNLHFTTHDKVTDIRYRQGPLERALGLASIVFATAGGEVRVRGVREAMALKTTAERARDAFVRTLLREAPAILAGAPAATAAEAPTAEREAPAGPAPPAPEWTGPRPAYLQPGDTPVWFAQPRLVAALAALRSLIGLIPILLFSNLLSGPQRLLVPLVAFGFVLMLVAVRMMQIRRTEYVVTDRRVYARSGIVGTTIRQLTYDKITDITYQQDVLGRLLGYGNVTVQTAGGAQAPITMMGLAKPLDAKETIEHWRDAVVGASR